MDCRARLACYPRGNFYPLSSGAPTSHQRITKTCFRTCSSCFSCSQAHFIPLRFKRDFLTREVYLSTFPLLFWREPPQLNCPPDLVPNPVFIRVMVRLKFKKERCFMLARRLPPTLHNFKFKSGSSYSKAPRGLFVQVWEGRIFTATAISPGLSSRQSLSRSTFRAGLNSMYYSIHF